MPTSLGRTCAALGLAGILCGCSGPDAENAAPVESATAAPPHGDPAPARPPLATPGDSLTPRPADTGGTTSPAAGAGLGRWDVAALEKRLDLQGMAPRKRPAPVRHPFLSVEGAAYQIGNAELQVFIYEDAEAVERDLSKLDTVTVAPRGQKVKWPDKPTLIRNNNLAAILLGQNALQIERVQRALMAGLPATP